jgi:murein DD-endopeptidase MepM/ murein hydrolase activator NlpD
VALSPRQVALLVAGMVAFPLLLAILFTYFLLFHAAAIPHPYLQSLVLRAQQNEQARNQAYVVDNLRGMAVKLGQMQAHVMRLDSLGDRLAKAAGISRQEFDFSKTPGQGGPVSAMPPRDLSMAELGEQLDLLHRQLDDRADRLGVLDALLRQQQVSRFALPTTRPVHTGWYSSNFGWRIDPFTGQKAFHEGVDFMAETGTAVYAAGAGVVVYSDKSNGYGNMVEIDHGNGLITRYGHASRLLVKVGDVVLKGQKIAEVGSTGRSTGPHLHFEVRDRGAPRNPEHYLQLSS